MINSDHLSDSIDTLKVIATKEESDFSLLCVQREPSVDEATVDHRSLSTNKIPAGLSGLMKQASLFSRHRDAVALDDDEEDDSWVTAELAYQLVRPVEETTVGQSGNQLQACGNSGVAIQTDSGAVGQIAVLSHAQMIHQSIDEPAWLERASAMGLEPLSIALGQPQPNGELWALRFRADSSSQWYVDSAKPLIVHLPTKSENVLLAIAEIDGRPKVRGAADSRSKQISITTLPNNQVSYIYIFQQNKASDAQEVRVGQFIV